MTRNWLLLKIFYRKIVAIARNASCILYNSVVIGVKILCKEPEQTGIIIDVKEESPVASAKKITRIIKEPFND